MYLRPLCTLGLLVNERLPHRRALMLNAQHCDRDSIWRTRVGTPLYDGVRRERESRDGPRVIAAAVTTYSRSRRNVTPDRGDVRSQIDSDRISHSRLISTCCDSACRPYLYLLRPSVRYRLVMLMEPDFVRRRVSKGHVFGNALRRKMAPPGGKKDTGVELNSHG